MKKSSKILAMILGVSVLIAGCGNTSPAETQTNETIQEESTQEESTQEVQVIKAGTAAFPKPYTFVGEDNELTGYDIEILRTIFDRLPQYELEIEITDFTSIFASLTSGLYDIGVNHFTYNEERGSSYLYSFPYDKSESVFVTKKGSEPITSFAEAAGKTYEGQAGISDTVAIEKWNEENPDLAIHIRYIDGDTAMVLQHIEDGSVDFGLLNLAMYQAYLEEYAYEVQSHSVPEEDKKTISDNLYAYYIFPQDKEALRAEVNAVLRELKEDGTLAEIGIKWFGQDASPAIEEYEETIN